jgi:hypothetical protein
MTRIERSFVPALVDVEVLERLIGRSLVAIERSQAILNRVAAVTCPFAQLNAALIDNDQVSS